MYYDVDYKLGENLHNNMNDVLKSKNSDKNMAPESENVTELNLIQDSRNGVRNYSTGHYFDVYKDVHENSSTGPLSCVSSTGDPMYNTAIAAGTQYHNMVCTKMTKMDYYFCPFCHLYPV